VRRVGATPARPSTGHEPALGLCGVKEAAVTPARARGARQRHTWTDAAPCVFVRPVDGDGGTQDPARVRLPAPGVDGVEGVCACGVGARWTGASAVRLGRGVGLFPPLPPQAVSPPRAQSGKGGKGGKVGGKGGKGGKAPNAKKTPQSRSQRAGLQVRRGWECGWARRRGCAGDEVGTGADGVGGALPARSVGRWGLRVCVGRGDVVGVRSVVPW